MKRVKQRLADQISTALDTEVELQDIETPRIQHAGYAYPIMQEANKQGQEPMKLARQTASDIEVQELPHIKSVAVAAPGYLNFKVDWSSYGAQLRSAAPLKPDETDEKVIVEHTCPTPINHCTWGRCGARSLGTR